MSARGHAELVAFAGRRLTALGLDPPLDPEALRRRLEDDRRSTIALVPTDELPPGSAFGVTGSRGGVDVVLYESRTTAAHQQLIVLHEYAHMLLRHPPSQILHTSSEIATFHEIDASAVAEALGLPAPEPEPDPPAARRRRFRRRAPSRNPSPPDALYAKVCEQEAETLATILLGWIRDHAGDVRARPPAGLDQYLGDQGAW